MEVMKAENETANDGQEAKNGGGGASLPACQLVQVEGTTLLVVWVSAGGGQGCVGSCLCGTWYLVRRRLSHAVFKYQTVLSVTNEHKHKGRGTGHILNRWVMNLLLYAARSTRWYLPVYWRPTGSSGMASLCPPDHLMHSPHASPSLISSTRRLLFPFPSPFRFLTGPCLSTFLFLAS